MGNHPSKKILPIKQKQLEAIANRLESCLAMVAMAEYNATGQKINYSIAGMANKESKLIAIRIMRHSDVSPSNPIAVYHIENKIVATEPSINDWIELHELAVTEMITRGMMSSVNEAQARLANMPESNENFNALSQFRTKTNGIITGK